MNHISDIKHLSTPIQKQISMGLSVSIHLVSKIRLLFVLSYIFKDSCVVNSIFLLNKGQKCLLFTLEDLDFLSSKFLCAGVTWSSSQHLVRAPAQETFTDLLPAYLLLFPDIVNCLSLTQEFCVFPYHPCLLDYK